MNKKTIIFDLDGTLANIETRVKMSKKSNGKMDWDVFFDPNNIGTDKPNHPVISMAQLYYDAGYKIMIFIT